jgi:hypothetical protein
MKGTTREDVGEQISLIAGVEQVYSMMDGDLTLVSRLRDREQMNDLIDVTSSQFVMNELKTEKQPFFNMYGEMHARPIDGE